ncbi:MAG: tetratricopeptide repeat protein, partial [Mariniphaga sp.]
LDFDLFNQLKMSRKIPILFSIVILPFIFSSCATILSGSRQRVLVETEPSGSRVFIDKKDQNFVTPCEIKVKRKKQIVFSFQKDGFKDEEKTVDAKFNPVVLGNVILGGLIGGAVDYGTGAWWKYENIVFSQLKNEEVKLNEAPPIQEPENPSYTNEVQKITTQKGYIIEVERTSIYVDYTSKDVKVGDRLQVVSEPKIMVHPVTKQKIVKEGELIATLEITETQSDYSVASKVIPSNAIAKLKVGDKVASPLQTRTNELFENEGRSKSIKETNVKDISSHNLISDKKITNDSKSQHVNIKPSLTRENNALEFYNHATEKLNSGDNKGAIDGFSKAIFLDREYAEAYNDRGVAYQRIRRYSKAIRDYKAALKIKPDFDIARDNKASAKSLRSERTSLIFSAVSLGLNAASTTINTINNNSSVQPTYSTVPNKTNFSNSTKRKCVRCGGTGINPYAESVATFGNTDEHWCDYCKKSVSASHGAHLRCPICKGTGYN